MNNIGTQTLQTKRLVLRRYTLDDAEAMYKNWATDRTVTKFLDWEPHANLEETRSILARWIEQYEQGGSYHWAIALDGRPIGDIAVVGCNTQNKWAEIGYALGRAYWGQGYMTEALGAVLNFLFVVVGLHRVFLRYDEQNPASGRVMEKNGLRYEGTQRQHKMRWDGTWADIRMYGILREEWLQR